MDMVFPILPSIPFPSTYTVLRLWDLCTRVAKVEDGWVPTIIPANYITRSAITSSALCAVHSLENYTPILTSTLLLLACSKYNYILLSLVPKPSSPQAIKVIKNWRWGRPRNKANFTGISLCSCNISLWLHCVYCRTIICLVCLGLVSTSRSVPSLPSLLCGLLPLASSLLF